MPLNGSYGIDTVRSEKIGVGQGERRMVAPQTSPDIAREGSRTDADPAAFVARFESAWATSDTETLLQLLTDDVVLIQPAMPTTTGKEEARDVFNRLFRLIPDLHTKVHGWAAHGDVLFIEFTLVGTFGGGEVSWPAVDRFVLRDGLGAERISYFDPLPLMLTTLKRPRGWRKFLTSGFRPSFSRTPNPNWEAR
jgi:ketosteroid isomerase-like protein